MDRGGRPPLPSIAVEQAANFFFAKTMIHTWTDKQKQFLRDNYAYTPTKEIAERIGRELQDVYRMAAKLGLAKSKEYMASPAACRFRRDGSIGVASRFQKGQTAWNKDKKIGSHPNSAKTQFKKGSKPPNRREIGEERTVDGYVYIKVQDGHKNQNWRLKHWVVWEQANGQTVPSNHLIHFRDNNKLNFALNNLELISKREWFLRHCIHNYPEPVKTMIRQLAGMKRKLNRYAKKQDRGSQEHPV